MGALVIWSSFKQLLFCNCNNAPGHVFEAGYFQQQVIQFLQGIEPPADFRFFFFENMLPVTHIIRMMAAHQVIIHEYPQRGKPEYLIVHLAEVFAVKV